MAERATRRQPEPGTNFSESQRKTPEIVKLEKTDLEYPKNAPRLELAPTPAEYDLEQFTYVPEQKVELMNEVGELEEFTVVSVNPDQADVFLQKTGDKNVAPSLEVMHQTELALEEATRPIAEAAGELWEAMVNKYAKTKTRTSGDDFKTRMHEYKGRVLRITALEVYENHPELMISKDPEQLNRVLDKTFSQFVIRESRRKIDSDPRHSAEDNLKAVSQYYEAIGHLREPEDENTEAGKLTKLVASKINVYNSDGTPSDDVTHVNIRLWTPSVEGEVPVGKPASRLDAERNRRPGYDKLRSQAVEAWSDFASEAKRAEQRLTTNDLSSGEMMRLYSDLQLSYLECSRQEANLNTLRLRDGRKDQTVSDEEYNAWTQLLKDLEAKPPVAEAIKTATARDNQEKLKARAQPKQTPPPLFAEPSRLARALDRITSWFEG
jgi:hypothetical protein